MKNKTILVPTDFSEVCLNAVRHAAEMAKRTGHQMIVLNVINKESRLFFKRNDSPPKAIIQKKMDEIKQLVLDNYGIEIRCEIREGSIYKEIPQAAVDFNALFLMIGTRGKAGIQKLIGHQALKLIEKVHVPTIIVQKRIFGQGYENIVFPVNVDIEYGHKVFWSIYFAQLFQSKVHVFLFREDNPALKERINKVRDNIEEAFRQADVPCTFTVAANQAGYARQLLDFAASVRADLIPIMTDNDQFEPAFVFTSLDEQMIYNTQQIPVMCINPGFFNE